MTKPGPDPWTMTAEDHAALLDLMRRVDDHEGPFGEIVTTHPDGTPCLPYSRNAAIVEETAGFLTQKNLQAAGFDWRGWETGRQAVQAGDSSALANCTAQECLQYLTLLVRAERFTEGTLARAFSHGLMQALLRQVSQYAEPGAERA